MPLPITDDHRTLAEVARSFLTGQRAAARALLDAPDEPVPAAWKEIAGLGWLDAGGGAGAPPGMLEVEGAASSRRST